MTNDLDDASGLNEASSSKLMRASMIFVLTLLLAPALFVAVHGGGLSLAPAIAVTAIMVLGLLAAFSKQIPGLLAGGRGPRILFALWVLLSVGAAYRLAHLSVFMFDSHNTEYSMPNSTRDFEDDDLEKPFFPKHNCFTSYIVATYLADQNTENIFLPSHYRDPETPTPIHATIGDLHGIDTYQYPPPFMLLPKVLMVVGKDFFSYRSIWFGLNVLMFVLTAVLLAHWLGGQHFSIYWFMLPVVLLSPIALGTLQMGNAHFLIIILTILSMLLLEQKRNVIGGAILGFAIVSKIFPGVFLVYLLCRRRFKPVIATGVAMITFSLLALLIFGQQPFHAFVTYHIPRLSNGDAFWFAKEKLGAILVNISMFGVAFKLDRLDWLSSLDPNKVASMIMHGYSVLLVIILVVSGHRHRHLLKLDSVDHDQTNERLTLVQMWFVILMLAQLRNPFLPLYGQLVIIWLLVLMVPRVSGKIWKVAGLVLAWMIYSMKVPLPWGPPTVEWDLRFGLAMTALTIAICLSVMLKKQRPKIDYAPS